MKPRRHVWLILAASICLVAGLVWLVVSTPKYPEALIRVVDAAGKPVAGAVVQPEGLRTKQGPYRSGWYGWGGSTRGVPSGPVVTDAAGFARVPYPKYVFEHIETGVIICSVSHPDLDFASERPERDVSIAPPAGAPWQVWRDYVLDRIQRKSPIARPDPVILQRGASVVVSIKPGFAGPLDAPLSAQVSGGQEPDSWIRTVPGVLVNHRLGAGPQTLRAVQVAANGAVWFSDVISFTAVPGQTNELLVALQPGVAVHGRLDDLAPRPIKNGRAVAHVWPPGLRPQNSPPQWHAWAAIREDGSFDFNSLPAGDLEIAVLCDGFVNTNGIARPGMVYPQKHVLGTNDLVVTVGMEPTARLEVRVADNQGKPLPGAHVSTWPNVRYGDWSATILASDCYNTADQFSAKSLTNHAGFRRVPVPDFEGTTDSAGLAVIPNLPVITTEFAVQHPRFQLPAVKTAFGEKRRQVTITLAPGQTNRIAVQLEPLNQSPIAHY